MTDIGPHGPQVRDEHDGEERGFDDLPVLEPPTTRSRPDVWTVVMGVVGGALADPPEDRPVADPRRVGVREILVGEVDPRRHGEVGDGCRQREAGDRGPDPRREPRATDEGRDDTRDGEALREEVVDAEDAFAGGPEREGVHEEVGRGEEHEQGQRIPRDRPLAATPADRERARRAGRPGRGVERGGGGAARAAARRAGRAGAQASGTHRGT